MFKQEIFHKKTNSVYYIHTVEEIKDESDKYNEFQHSEDPTQLGFTFERELFVSDESQTL